MSIDKRSAKKQRLDISSSDSESEGPSIENDLSIRNIDAILSRIDYHLQKISSYEASKSDSNKSSNVRRRANGRKVNSGSKSSSSNTDSHFDNTGATVVPGSSEDNDVKVEIEKILDVIVSGDRLTRAMEDKLMELVKTIIYSRLTIGKGAETLREKLFKYLSLPVHNFFDQTHLYEAIKKNDKNRVKHLLERNFDINSAVAYNHSDCGGLTALGVAVELDRKDIVQLLLDHESCDVNAAAESGLTPLHIAALKNNPTIAKKLISKGATIDVYSKYQPIFNSSFFRWAVLKNYVLNESCDFVEALNTNIDMEDLDGMTALQVAAKVGSLDMVQLLLEHGADLNAQCLNRGDGYTALHYAVTNENIPMVDLFLDRGASINVKSNDEQSILHLSVETGSEAIVKRLLNAGADVNIRSNVDFYEGITPVIEATKRSFTTIMLLLMDKGANISAFVVHKLSSALLNIIDFIVDSGSLNFIMMPISYTRFHNYEHGQILLRNTEKLLQHIVKCSVVGYVESDFFMFVSAGFRNYKEFKNECKIQVEKMKKEKIEGTHVCYHDLFFKNVYQMAVYAKNKNIEKAMILPDLMSKFPFYAHMLVDSFDKGRQRNQLLENVHDNLKDIFINLPYYCVTQILKHLSNHDLSKCSKKI